MKAARIVIMAGALAAATGAGFIAMSLANRPAPQQEAGPAAPTIETEEVLVAAGDIALGTALSSDKVRWQEWPKAGVSPEFLTRTIAPDAPGTMEGAIARAGFFAGEPIREAKIVRSDRGYMSAILPSGQRAVATNISTATSAGGFILPNDHVDVIMTRPLEGGDPGQYITETILQNVRVLAIDQTIEELDGKPVVVGETATLQLTQRQAEVLTVAQQMAARLALTLRSVSDAREDQTDAAYHLIGGDRGKGTVRLIRFGNSKDILLSGSSSGPSSSSAAAGAATAGTGDMPAGGTEAGTGGGNQ
jgi:pilus assembly protein CpaB